VELTVDNVISVTFGGRDVNLQTEDVGNANNSIKILLPLSPSFCSSPLSSSYFYKKNKKIKKMEKKMEKKNNLFLLFII